ncbi:unnamed protein product [Rhizoctonia solani]|uniref:DUF4939 domain-containing protein n=1 Tax=Rhizoctonia solani TaxID=456999 RepID=A0A8H3G9P9_9AGAM|nr:unnamed protein product [Rhizoctonia solani]
MSHKPTPLCSFSLAPSSGEAKMAKMDVPKPYNGATNGQVADQWLTCMALYIAMNKNQFKNEEQRMVWVLYNLEGKAADWATPIIGEIMGQKITAPWNMNDLGEQLKAAFTDPDAKRAAG